MTRERNAACTKCGNPMWWKANNSQPKDKIVCHPCRRAANALKPPPMGTAERSILANEARLKLIDITCETCAEKFQAVKGRRFCDACREIRRGDHYRRKGAGRRATRPVDCKTGERITITALGDRDAWTCWLCNQFVNRDLTGRDPWMPSFDHVLPISRGGLDSWDNLRLAHLTCNVKRGNKIMVNAS